MATWAQVRKFAEKCLDIVYKLQKYPSGKEIALASLLELGKLGFLVEGVYQAVRPLTDATFREINTAMVELNQRETVRPEQKIIIATDPFAYKRLAKIVAVLKDQLHVVPEEGVNLDIWREVLAVKKPR